jgi:hypothetical protein
VPFGGRNVRLGATSSCTETRCAPPPFGAAAGQWREATGLACLESKFERAERFVGSAKSECLERIVLLGEGHLRAAVRAFVQHYHEERPHQGLGNELIAPKTTSIGTGPVTCHARLGGVLKFYYRKAA